jgi:hypothetical protein
LDAVCLGISLHDQLSVMLLPIHATLTASDAGTLTLFSQSVSAAFICSFLSVTHLTHRFPEKMHLSSLFCLLCRDLNKILYFCRNKQINHDEEDIFYMPAMPADTFCISTGTSAESCTKDQRLFHGEVC